MKSADPQPAEPNSKRRWYQYGLQSLLALVLFASVSMGVGRCFYLAYLAYITPFPLTDQDDWSKYVWQRVTLLDCTYGGFVDGLGHAWCGERGILVLSPASPDPMGKKGIAITGILQRADGVYAIDIETWEEGQQEHTR